MYNVYTWYKQLSQQYFVVDRETQMQDSGTSLMTAVTTWSCSVYINIYVHVCNMHIQRHKFMYMHVHTS
jgi:hypothetical protein